MGRGKKNKRALSKPKAVFLPDVVRGVVEVAAAGQHVGYQISKHNIPQIWLETEGEDIVVAVIDTGCQDGHPDLINTVIRGGDHAQGDQQPDDGNGHGTHCTGIITANNNDKGVVGVAPKSKVYAIKVLGDDGSGTFEAVIAGIREAIDAKVDIISLSLGSPDPEPALHEVIKAAYQANIPCICAAGNSGNIGTLDYPGRYPETISIGALDDKNLRAEWSQTGTKLDFMAPGVAILSTYPVNTYEHLSGTSMATPWAAGVIALMMAKHRKIGGQTPLHTVEDVREHLRKTAIDLAVAGKDPQTGFGLVDVGTALSQIEPPAPEPDPIPDEGETEMPDKYDDLITKLTTWVNEVKVKTAERDNLQGQVDQLQQQLDELKAQVEAKSAALVGDETKAGEIDLILNG